MTSWQISLSKCEGFEIFFYTLSISFLGKCNVNIFRDSTLNWALNRVLGDLELFVLGDYPFLMADESKVITRKKNIEY